MSDTPRGVGEPAVPGKFPGTQRWVKVGALVVLVLLLVLALVVVFGPGDHGPGRHGGTHTREPVGPPAPIGETIGPAGPGAVKDRVAGPDATA